MHGFFVHFLNSLNCAPLSSFSLNLVFIIFIIFLEVTKLTEAVGVVRLIRVLALCDILKCVLSSRVIAIIAHVSCELVLILVGTNEFIFWFILFWWFVHILFYFFRWGVNEWPHKSGTGRVLWLRVLASRFICLFFMHL